MKAIWNGHLLAESDDTIVIEKNHYFPPSSLTMAFFTNSETTSINMCQRLIVSNISEYCSLTPINWGERRQTSIHI